MTLLTLDDAQTIVSHALQHARSEGFEPLTVVVLDAAGVMKAAGREDGSGLIRPDIAHAKAWGALGMGLPSRELGRRSELMPAFFQALGPLSQGRLVPVPGGVLIMRSGQIIGAVGVSGDNSDNDELCAVAGVTAAGLEADSAAEPPIRHSAF
jgi:uncharacterized protein GlcG (DUF336 family)